MAYDPKRQSEKLDIPVRGLKYRIYRWGESAAEPVFLLHGWADTGMSFQFLADALSEKWCIYAPDWRGFGDSDWNNQGYWFPDYLADLDAIIEACAPDKRVRLVGHSMGGNVVLLYAGIRPERVAHAVTLEQFGLPDSDPGAAPERYAKWLNQWRSPPVNLEYDNIEDMVLRLQALAPHITDEHAEFLAPYWCKETMQRKYISKIDPGHKRVNPVLYRRAEARACWRNITARTMLVLGAESDLYRRYQEEDLGADFKTCFNTLQEIIISNCGHMVHLDQPESTAAVLDEFLATTTAGS